MVRILTATRTLSPARIPRPEFITGGCVLDLKMDEGEGTTAHDTSGHGNHGTLYGPTWVDGYYGKALSFDGVNDYVGVPNSLSLNITGNKISIECRFKVTTFKDYARLVAKETYGVARQYFVLLDNVKRIYWLVVIGGSSYYSPKSSPLSAGVWYHYVAVYDGSKIRGYLNGVEITPATSITGNISSTTENVYIGKEGSGANFHGLIDEVRIYNQALTSEEIKAHFLGARVPIVRQL